MYQQHFGFSGFPFSIAPDPKVVYLSQMHRQALQKLRYGMQREGGFLLLTGEVGTGKTSITRLFLQQLETSIRVAYILNPRLNERDLLLSIAEEIQLPGAEKAASIRELIGQLNQELLSSHATGNHVLLVIEEAQNLSPEILEMLRLLTNLETDTHKLLSILLIGQPELLSLIDSPQMSQLHQRIMVRCHLRPLSLSESWHYLDYRLHQVGGASQVLSLLARVSLFLHSRGVPRKMNLLADAALLDTYQRHQRRVGCRAIKRAVVASRYRKKLVSRPLRLFTVTLLATAIIAAAVYRYPQELTAIFWQPAEPVAKVQLPAPEPQSKLSDTVGESQSQKLLPLTRLLHLWGQTDVIEQGWEQYCRSPQSQLLCFEDNQLDIEGIRQLDLPVLITLRREARIETLVLASLGDEETKLYRGDSLQTLTLSDLRRNRLGSIRLLWPRIPGYRALVRPGARNKVLMDWVQESLIDKGIMPEPLITGGIYNDILVGYVKQFQQSQQLQEDGILGIKTLVKLMPTSASTPSLSH